MFGTLVIDVGGTFIKYGVADGSGALIEESVSQIHAHSDGTVNEVYSVFEGIIKRSSYYAQFNNVCISVPGPFDFESGTFKMVHKYRSLFGHSVSHLFEDTGLPVRYLHDSTAYILGECTEGLLQGALSPCCVMLGTGLGFAMMQNGHVLIDNAQTPALALWKIQYRNGIAEDYVSARAIIDDFDGRTPVNKIADYAKQGNAKAISAFRHTGEHLSTLLQMVMARFGCDRVGLGGQIARSAELLGLSLAGNWGVCHKLDDAALRGAALYAYTPMDELVKVVPKLAINGQEGDNVI